MTKRKPTEKRQPTTDAELAAVEACELLGLGHDPSRLCPADRLKVDLVSTLRLVIDHAGEVILEGGTADLGRLVTAVEHLTKLLPAREPQPKRDGREAAIAPLLKLFRQLHEEVHALSAENAQLKAALAAGPAPAGTTSPPQPESPPAPTGGNVVPLSPPPSAAPAPQPQPAPAYDYNVDRSWRDHVLPDGSISPTPMSRTRWWGPV